LFAARIQADRNHEREIAKNDGGVQRRQHVGPHVLDFDP
jgi:hypothetical protein